MDDKFEFFDKAPPELQVETEQYCTISCVK
jgi:hypothetical protein